MVTKLKIHKTISIKQKYLFGLVLAVSGILFILTPHHANASTGINQELSFEGKIVNGSGINITDGTYNMEFKIYAGCTNEPTNNTGCSLDWTEDELVSASQGVVFTSGTFQVNLGAVTAFGSSVNWNTYPLYLSLQIGSTSSCTPAGNFTTNCGGDGEMNPYILLTSTPYAFNSNELGGLSSSAFGQLSANQTWTGTDTFQPTTNISSVVVQQTSASSPSADTFDVETANATKVIQVTSTAANAAAVNIAAQGSGNNIDLTTSTSSASIILNSPTVLIGSNSTSNTTQDLLQLNSDTTDTASCSTSTNQGGLYYNTTNNSMRVCEDGAWRDIITTQGLGILLYGVVPDSGSNPGDLESLSSSGVTGPCKVSWASSTSVTVQPCTVYSGGQKIEQSSVTVTLPSGMTALQYTHLCYYNGTSATGPITNSTSFFTTPSTTETANLPPFSATAPIVCLATIENQFGTGTIIAQLSDTRVFTTSQKQFAYSTAAAPGWIVIYVTSNTTEVATTGTAGTAGVAGIVVTGNSSAYSSGGPNVIIATGGPAEVEDSGATNTSAYNYLETSIVAGYVKAITSPSATLTQSGLYLGLAYTAYANCSSPSASDCQGSVLTQINLIE